MRRFFIDENLTGQDSFVITGAEAKHISRVLRMGPGERIVLLDKVGQRFQAVIKEVNRLHVLVDLERPVPAPAPSFVHITLCQALLKSHHMDLVVEKTSELGVDRVLPYLAERTVVKVDGVYVMMYGCYRNDDVHTALGMAVSKDGLNWTKNPHNPVFRPEGIGPPGEDPLKTGDHRLRPDPRPHIRRLVGSV